MRIAPTTERRGEECSLFYADFTPARAWKVKERQKLRRFTKETSCLDWPAALQSLRRAQKSALQLDAKAATAALAACKKQEQWPAALQLLLEFGHFALQLDIVAVSTVITASEKCSQWKQALQLLHGTGRLLQLDVVAWSAATSACAAASATQWQLATHLVAPGSLKLGMAHNAAITACERASGWVMALGLLERLRKPQRASAVSYNSAMSALQQGSQWRPGLQLLDLLLQAGLQASPVTVGAASLAPWRRAFAALANFGDPEVEDNAIAFNAILSSCDARPSFVVELLRSMQKRKVRATVISYNSAITACKKSWKLSVHLLEDMQRAQLLPDAVSFNSGITASETGANWQLAMMLMGCMPCMRLTSSVINLTAAISACEAASRWQSAAGLLGSMKSHGLVPNLNTFNSAAAAYEKAGRWELAAETLDLVEPGLITYNCVLRSCVTCTRPRWPRWHFTLQLLEEMSKAAILADLISYNMAALACESERMTEHFQVLLDQVLPEHLQKLLRTLSTS